MPTIKTVHPTDSKTHQFLSDQLKRHYIKVCEAGIPYSSDEDLATVQLALAKADIESDVLMMVGDAVHLFRRDQHYVYKESSRAESISRYVIEQYRHGPNSLSCRKENLYLLEGMVQDGSPDFTKSPEAWVRENPFFDLLRPKPFYDRLLAFNLDERGMFLKVWQYRAQRNYFHPAVNSGLPLVKKKDPIHEGTFMMHDMFHYIFLDPIITGHETEEEKIVYIACRMMSEACTLVLADMIAVAHSGIEDLGYDTFKRKIYPLFRSLELNPYDIETVRKTLYANCAYVMYGLTEAFNNLDADPAALDLYTGKYENFFSGDFKWNKVNIDRVSEIMNSYPGLEYYFRDLDDDYKKFNTRFLTSQIRGENGQLSFNALFEMFWQQLEKLILYEDSSDKTRYVKKAYLKYISGQIYLVYRYYHLPPAQEVINAYRKMVPELKKAEDDQSAAIIGRTLVNKVNAFIDLLVDKQLLTTIEAEINKLHVTHFPAEYVNYDKDDFEPLSEVATRMLGDYFVREDFRYKKMDAALRDYYFEIVGGEHEGR